jgi:hypothetical protein
MPTSMYKLNRWIAGIDWLGITRILAIQIIVMFVLSLAVMRYLAWTSDQAQTEFDRILQQSASENPAMPVQKMAVVRSSSQGDSAGCFNRVGQAIKANAMKFKKL